MTEKRGKHSHRCKICRQGTYCYKQACGLPQKLEACAECRRTGRYVAPRVTVAETVPVKHELPPLKGWLAGLPPETRETVFALMRDIDHVAERANEQHMQLRPEYGEIAVGGAHMDPFFRCEGLRGLLRGLRDGMTPSDAARAGNDAANYAIGRWNASREWQVHRAMDSELNALQYQASRVSLAVQESHV